MSAFVFHIGPLAITGFGVMVATGVLAGLWIFQKETAVRALPPHATDVGMAGVVGGAVGGLVLAAVPSSTASFAVAPALAVIGAFCGAAGGAGVGAGLSAAESIFRSRRAIALVAGAAVGGGLAGSAVQWLGRWSLAALVGINIAAMNWGRVAPGKDALTLINTDQPIPANVQDELKALPHVVGACHIVV